MALAVSRKLFSSISHPYAFQELQPRAGSLPTSSGNTKAPTPAFRRNAYLSECMTICAVEILPSLYS